MAGTAGLTAAYTQLQDPYLRMPSGVTDIHAAALVDGYSTALLALVVSAVALWVRPRAAAAAGFVVGSALWLVLIAASQLGNSAVYSSSPDGKAWQATVDIGLALAAAGVLALAQQGLLRGRFAARQPPRAELLVVVAGLVLLTVSLALPFNGTAAIAHQTHLAPVVAFPAGVLAGLVAFTSLGRSRGDALTGAAAAYLLLDFALTLLLSMHDGATYATAPLVATLLLATALVLRRSPRT